MNKYYFLRHADTDRTQDLHFSEHPLSKLGQAQAEQLIPFLEKLDIDYVFSSPFNRALQTVKPFLAFSKIELGIVDSLKGRIIGELSKEETWPFFQKSWSDFDYQEKGAESARECQNRVSQFLFELDQKYNDKSILLISHSNPIAFFLTTLDENIDYQWFRTMKSPSLFYVDLISQNYQELEVVND